MEGCYRVPCYWQLLLISGDRHNYQVRNGVMPLSPSEVGRARLASWREPQHELRLGRAGDQTFDAPSQHRERNKASMLRSSLRRGLCPAAAQTAVSSNGISING
jgi:hypothetical protein